MVYAVIGLIALALFGASVLVRSAAVRHLEQARHWPSVQGRIAGSIVRSNSGGTSMPEVSYTYVINGVGYASDRINPGGTPSFRTPAKAMAVAARYTPGDTVHVRYDPSRPERPAIELALMTQWVLPLRILAGVALVVAVAIAVTGK